METDAFAKRTEQIDRLRHSLSKRGVSGEIVCFGRMLLIVCRLIEVSKVIIEKDERETVRSCGQEG